MKGRLLILLFFLSVVSAAQLPVELIGTPSFSGCNCRADGTPNTFEVGFTIQNPSSYPLQLSYEWYDFSTNSFRRGEGMKCSGGTTTVAPKGYASCFVYLPTMMGGLNGSGKMWVKVIGRDGFEEYNKTFGVDVEYHTSPYEANIVTRMNEVELSLRLLEDELGGRCYREVCCGMRQPALFIQHALLNLNDANSSLRACALTSAWNYVLNASNLLREANFTFLKFKNNCSAALSLINSTQLRIASVGDVVLEGRKCGANVTLSEATLRSANSSLEEAKRAVGEDNYTLAFSKLASADELIKSAVKSIGKCPQNPTNQTTLPPATQSETKEEPAQDYSVLLVAGGVALVIILVAVVAVLLLIRARQPKPAKTTPPSPPPTFQMSEDLEKEFNEWLESTKKK